AEHAVALRRNGTVVCWGRNVEGECNVPSGLTDVIQIAAGYDFSLARKRDGTVVAWGGNAFGQSNVPSGLTDVVEIAAGAATGLARQSDGTIVGWGRNTSGQIPAGVMNAAHLAAGLDHSLVVTTSPGQQCVDASPCSQNPASCDANPTAS